MRIIVVLISFIAMLMVILPGPIYKYGSVDLGTALMGFTIGMFAGIAALLLLVIQALFKRHTLTLASALSVVVFLL